MKYSVYAADKTTLDALHVDINKFKTRLEDLHELMEKTWGEKPMFPDETSESGSGS